MKQIKVALRMKTINPHKKGYLNGSLFLFSYLFIPFI